jgi:AcrR family transcriptional regulator
MNPAVTSREAILAASRRLMGEQGWTAVQIRAVAASCGVAVGSIYHYFSSKTELVAATVESVWTDIFPPCADAETLSSITAYIRWLYACLKAGAEKYPGFFSLHAAGFDYPEKETGKRHMQRSWVRMQSTLCSVLKADPSVRSDAFNEAFTPEKLAHLVFSLLLASLLQGHYDEGVIVEVVRRSVC